MRNLLSMSLYLCHATKKSTFSKKHGLNTYIDNKAFVGFCLKEANRIIYSAFICPPANVKVSQLLFFRGGLM
jgi:hypothetical protein